MADKNEYQKQLDELILQQERLKDKIEQSKVSLEYFENKLKEASDATKKASEKDKKAAEEREEAAKKDLEVAKKRLVSAEREDDIFKSMLDKRKEQIKKYAEKAGAKVKERSNYAEIIQEENAPKKEFSFDNFKESLREKGGGGKHGIALGAMKLAGEAINVGTDIYIAEQQKSLNTWMANQDAYLKTLETGSKIFQRHLKTFSKGMQGALSASFASITQGVQEGAYSAATSSIDFATETLTNTFADELDKLQLQNFKKLNQKKVELENLKLTGQEVNGAIGFASNVASMFGPIGEAVGSLVSDIAKATTKILEANAEIDIMRLQKEIELKEKEIEAINEAKTSAIESAKETTSKVLEFSRAIENLSLKTDVAAKSMANIIGMSGSNADAYESFIYGATRNLKFTDSTGKTTYLNKNADDMLKMQSQYIEASERNGIMSQNDFVKTFQLGTVVGDDNLAATLLGDMDYFNKSIATSTDLIFEMFKEANKAGVSNRKFAKDLQQNLKLAQKYTFKGGTQAMMKMSIWAQKVRFNMQGLEGMVDKIQDGGLEGVITQAAKLQVLGGNMAMGADPIAMMYEAWADPEALAKRFTDMTKGIGRFNSETGEVDINGPDAMRLKAYAEAIGMDYKDARAQVTQRIKGEQIDKQLYKNYTDDQKALIYNKAKLGENGQWEVNVLDKDTNNIVTKNVNDLEESDWNSLMPTEESIENYVGKIYNLLDQQGGVTNFSQSVMADETFKNLKQNINDRMTENLNWVTEKSGELKTMIEQSNNFVTVQNKQQHDLMIATSNILDEQFKLMEKATEKLRLGIQNSGSQIRLALDAVKAELDYELAKLNNANEETLKELEKKSASARNALATDVLGEASEYKAGTKISEQNYKDAQAALDFFLSKSTKSNINNAMAMLISKHEAGERDLSEYEPALSEGMQDLLNGFMAAGLGRNNMKDVNKYGPAFIDALVKYASTKGEDIFDPRLLQRIKAQGEKIIIDKPTDTKSQTGPSDSRYGYKPILNNSNNNGGASGGYIPSSFLGDGVINNNNKPILAQATNVTKVQDGTSRFVQSDRKDSALFAKDGGAFDTLFNGVLNKVEALYDAYTNPSVVSSDIGGLVSDIGGTVKFETLKVELNGRLDLSSGDKSVDIIGELQNNPILLRSLSRMLAQQFSKAFNGGKGYLPISISNVYDFT